MSVIEDTRRLLQDFLAPELRELTARIDALEESLGSRISTFERSVDSRFEAAERLASERHAQAMQAIGRLADVYELRERVARIEAGQRAS